MAKDVATEAAPQTIAEPIDAQLIRLAADHAVHAHDALMRQNLRLSDANLGIAKGLMMAREVIAKTVLDFSNADSE